MLPAKNVQCAFVCLFVWLGNSTTAHFPTHYLLIRKPRVAKHTCIHIYVCISWFWPIIFPWHYLWHSNLEGVWFYDLASAFSYFFYARPGVFSAHLMSDVISSTANVSWHEFCVSLFAQCIFEIGQRSLESTFKSQVEQMLYNSKLLSAELI